MTAVVEMKPAGALAHTQNTIRIAAEDRRTRAQLMSNARAHIRMAGMRTVREVLDMVACVQAAIPADALDSDLLDAREQLIEVCSDIDARLQS
jgi:ferritin-like protein